MEEVAVKVDSVSKDFRLPHERVSSIKGIVTHFLSYIRKHKRFETQHALKDVSFEIKKGEFIGIVGRNGSGKSTLLKMIAGIYQPSKGRIQVNGRLVPFIELGVGFNGELTGRENVYLNGALLGFSKEEIDNLYDDIVEFAELQKFMDQKLKNYSSGMQVRLAFSLAIRAEADILLVDEVLAVGDADFQRKCYSHFRKLKKEKKTVVFVSHDMGAIRSFCDRAILIEKSQIILEGKVNKVATAYTRMFMEDPQQSEKPASKNGKRMGNKKLEFLSVRPEKNDYTDMEPINIRCTIRANSDVDDIVLGFSVKNQGDTQMAGVNTNLLRKKIPGLRSGEKLTFNWELPNIFNDGLYYIDVAAHDTDGNNYDWWEEASDFTVCKEEKTAYATMPDIKFTLIQGK
jgi:ABC-2 type transport system ATP-binding protein